MHTVTEMIVTLMYEMHVGVWIRTGRAVNYGTRYE